MPITLNADDSKEIRKRAKEDHRVIMRFYEALEEHKSFFSDEVLACRLALREQAKLFKKIYHEKEEEYLTEVKGDCRKRLEVGKTWGSGLRYKTKSGIRVRSKAEKIIADFLYDHGIHFTYEPIVTLDGFCLMPDFYLPDSDVVYEHFGFEGEDYLRAAESKIARYQRFKIKFICTTAADEPDIEDVLTRKLAEAGVLIEDTG